MASSPSGEICDIAAGHSYTLTSNLRVGHSETETGPGRNTTQQPDYDAERRDAQADTRSHWM